MFDLNVISIIGRLTKDPELRYTNSGKAVCNFSIANNHTNSEDKVSFFEIQAWEKSAENVGKYMRKGSQVAVTGALSQQRWEKDGQKHSKVIIESRNINFIGKPADINDDSEPQERQVDNPPPPTQKPEPEDSGDIDDTIPF